MRIFSVHTLHLPRRLPKAALLAASLCCAAELAARGAVASGRVKMDFSLRSLLERDVALVRAAPSDVWLLGNSTLERGIDAAQFFRLTRCRPLVLSHGSATPRASAALLRYCLAHTPNPPRAVLLFCTADDFNQNGYRAEHSARYLAVTSALACEPQSYLMLFRARRHLVAALSTMLRFKSYRPKPASHNGTQRFHGKAIALDDRTHRDIVREFKIDGQAVAEFAGVAHSGVGSTSVGCVLVPVTDVYARYHDVAVPALRLEAIQRAVARMCLESGVDVLDATGPSAAYSHFSDDYHLNDVGREQLTVIVAHWFVAHFRAGDPQVADGVASLDSSASDAWARLGMNAPRPEP